MKTLTSPFFWLVLIVVGGISAIPILTNSSSLREDLMAMLVLVILASSVNIIMGYTGYVSFGHIVYYGIGGYVAFYLALNLVHIYVAALIGGLVASLIAFLIGTPVLRLRGAYFALATIGINEAMRAFISNFPLFGASIGMLFNRSVYEPYGGGASFQQLVYVGMVITALLTIATSFIIKKSKFGLSLMAIREDQDAAMVLGINPARAKVITYAISAFFPALAGAFFFYKNATILPQDAFDLYKSIEALVMVMLGGYGTVTGPIVGAVVYERLRGFLITDPILSKAHLVIAGVLLLLIVLFVTAGVVGWLRQRFPAVRRYLE